MGEILLPPHLPVARVSFVPDDRTAVDESPITGAIQTSEIYGTRRQRIRLDFQNLDSRSGNLQKYRAFVGALQGRKNRVWIRDPSYFQQGSFSATELLTNNDFSNGTTGWSAGGSAGISVTDRVLRLTRTAYDVSNGGIASTATASLTQYTPYVARSFHQGGSYPVTNAGPTLSQNGGAIGSTSRGAAGLRSAMLVPYTAGAGTFLFYDYPEGASLTQGAGAFVDVNWTSVSQCALVDGGGNLLTYSDQIDNAAWTASAAGIASVSANASTAPDGTATAEAVNEDGAAGVHYVTNSATVSSAAADYCFSVAVKAGNRSWCALEIREDTGSTALNQYFNSSTGAIGAAGTTGANWANRRAFAKDAGGGWFIFTIIGRKTNAATALSVRVYGATADGTASYTGGSFSTFGLWRATLTQSSVPSRLVQSVAAAVTASAQTGSGIYVKGLPASTLGLGREGDQVQIDRFLRFLTGRLDSDAAGQGYLPLNEPIPGGIANDTPVIFHAPMGRFMLAGDAGYDIEPGLFGSASLELVEA